MAGKPKTNAGMFLAMLFGAMFRRRSRAGMAVVASLVGTATLFCLATICIAVPQQMNQEMRAYGANLIVTSLGPGTGGTAGAAASTGIDGAMVQHTNEMVRAKGAAVHATYRYENVRINSAPYVLAGIEPNDVRNLNRHWDVNGQWPARGGVLVGRDVADALGLAVGSTMKIAYRASDNVTSGSSGVRPNAGNGTASSAPTPQKTRDGRVSSNIMDTSGTEYRVSGIVDTGGSQDSIIYALGSDVDALTGVKRGVDVIEYSSQATGRDLSALVAGINDMTSMHVKAEQVTRITASETSIIAMLQTLFWLVSLVVLALTLVGVGTTVSSIVSQRRNEIGLRKALGASSASIGVEFYVESALYGLIGGLIGTAMGYLFARVLCQTVFNRVVEFSWPLAAVSLVVSVTIAVIGAIAPVARATRIDPAIVLREE